MSNPVKNQKSKSFNDKLISVKVVAFFQPLVGPAGLNSGSVIDAVKHSDKYRVWLNPRGRYFLIQQTVSGKEDAVLVPMERIAWWQ